MPSAAETTTSTSAIRNRSAKYPGRSSVQLLNVSCVYIAATQKNNSYSLRSIWRAIQTFLHHLLHEDEAEEGETAMQHLAVHIEAVVEEEVEEVVEEDEATTTIPT